MYKLEIKKTQGGRDTISASYRIDNAHAPNDADEINSEILDTTIIKDVVEKCNELSMPAMLNLVFKSSYFEKFLELNIPILPVCVDKRKNDADFVRNYLYYDGTASTKTLAESDVKQRLYDKETEIAKQVQAIKEHIKRELSIQYFKYKESGLKSNDAKCEYAENMYMLREFNLKNKKKTKNNESLDRTYHLDTYFDENSSADADAVRNFSRAFQLLHPNDVCFAYAHGGEYIIGLRHGENPGEIESIATKDSDAAQYKISLLKTTSIFDNYKRTKEHQRANSEYSY
jgi:hypothetical protein